MRRVALALFSTITGLVMILGFKTHNNVGSVPVAASTTGPTTDPTTPAATTPTTGSTTAPTSTTRTVLGDSIDTRWGPVQVQITVTNGKVSAASAVVYPNGNSRDQEINAYAIPALNQEATAAGTAQIDTISGATVTSDGYLSSLQSALDKAGL